MGFDDGQSDGPHPRGEPARIERRYALGEHFGSGPSVASICDVATAARAITDARRLG